MLPGEQVQRERVREPLCRSQRTDDAMAKLLFDGVGVELPDGAEGAVAFEECGVAKAAALDVIDAVDPTGALVPLLKNSKPNDAYQWVSPMERW